MEYRVNSLRLPIEQPHEVLFSAAAKKMGIRVEDVTGLKLYRKSLDARKKTFFYTYTVDVSVKDGVAVRLSEHCQKKPQEREYSILSSSLPKAPVVVGFGPAGIFCALRLAQAGLCPIVLERGKAMCERVRDVDVFRLTGRLDPESNVQYGEGGAGAFSDGKLNTLLKEKNVAGRFVLETFVRAGAPEEILYWNKPHVGTDLLQQIIPRIRAQIEQLGGKVIFGARFLRPRLQNGALVGLVYEQEGQEKELSASAVFLGIGHSARDTFLSLQKSGVPMEKKIFSVGLRIEHLQEKIDLAQYGIPRKETGLPPADYKLAVPVTGGKRLYTFCMCPGGEVVAATGNENSVVTNGMSYHARQGKNANSALLLNVLPEELGEDLFSGFYLQEKLEKNAFSPAMSPYAAPCQRVGDFLSKRGSSFFGEVTPSYARGTYFRPMDEILPQGFAPLFREGLEKMNERLSGFSHPDALLIGPESRATCPVRLCRDENLQSPVQGLYPIGEGAGYAGGIMSSAMDGLRAAEKYLSSGEKE